MTILTVHNLPDDVDTKGAITMRDPAGNAETYANFFYHTRSLTPEEFAELAPHSREAWMRSSFNYLPRDPVHLYGRGDSLDDIRAAVLAVSASMLEARDYLREHAEPSPGDPFPLKGNERDDVGFTALALLLLDDPACLATVRELLFPFGEERAYLFDVLVKSFIADYPLAKKYKAKKYAAPWTEPVLRALAEPPERRAAALAAHMKNWCRIMRPWGWKPTLDTAPGKDKLFCDFAFEVALAVCAYDIDDSSFQDHPYYPRDLAQNYRARVRATRDAWRPAQAGAGVALVVPPPPAKADLARTKRKGLARWVELVCDGQIDATEAVLEAVGRPRKFKEIDELMCALAEQEQAIHADIKDDDSVAAFAATLAEGRGLGQFDMPPGPPFGPARASATLLAFSQWLVQRGYRLIDLDDQDDGWHAVLIKAGYQQELLDLGAGLGLVARDPAKAYSGA